LKWEELKKIPRIQEGKHKTKGLVLLHSSQKITELHKKVTRITNDGKNEMDYNVNTLESLRNKCSHLA